METMRYGEGRGSGETGYQNTGMSRKAVSGFFIVTYRRLSGHPASPVNPRLRYPAVLVFCLSFIFMGSPLFAAEKSYDLSAANAAYQEALYPKAIDLYEGLRAQGLNHWVLYYNLGNAYYKSGRNGKAAANYLRALRLNPRHRDLIHNADLVLMQAGDPLLPPRGLSQLFWKTYQGLPLEIPAVLAAVLLVFLGIGGGLAVLGFWKPPLNAEATVGCLLILVVALAWIGSRIALDRRAIGVVTMPMAEVRSGPGEHYSANFTIPAGRRLLILPEGQAIKGWLQVGVAKEGLKGWIATQDVDVL